MGICQNIGKIIDIEKLSLEIIDSVINIGNCITFDPINATLMFCIFIFFCTFLVLFYAF